MHYTELHAIQEERSEKTGSLETILAEIKTIVLM